MNEAKIRELLNEGEGFTVEYKECVNALSDSVFDTVVTNSADLVANLYNRKSSAYHERKIFPYATTDHLQMSLLPRIRNMAITRRPDHPWKDVDDMTLLRNAGLYEENILTGEKGFNLAAILLLGKEEVIQNACPGYRTDAIYRDEHPDRYDDRLIVETNLIESYDLLMGFIAKHTNDKFFLIDNVNTSVRDIIAREIVSNILVHREYSSAFPAKLVIEPDRITSENWNRSYFPGRINPDTFTPYPKNPILAKFFMSIGRADTLGSGVRNLYKYTKIYSGGEPELEEGDVFKIFVPLKPDGRGNLNQYDVSERQQAILGMIRENPLVQYGDIENKLNLSTSTVRREIQEIKKRVNLSYTKKLGKWRLEE